MNKNVVLKLVGVVSYLLAMVALQQVIMIPLIALLLIVVIYKAKSELAKTHAKFIISIFAITAAVVMITAKVVSGEQQIFAAMVVISLAFAMLAYGAVRVGLAKYPFARS